MSYPTGVFKSTILVVDDTPDNLRLLVNLLGEQGYTVRPARNGPAALASAQANPPDLVLLDVMMPEMDGFTVCKTLKADDRTRDIPIIFITALDTVADKVKAFAEGGVDYITKPFQAGEVLARINTHLALAHLQKSLQEQNERLQTENERRRRVQDALRESRERYRLLADNSTDLISRQSVEGIYLYVSPACDILLGYKIEEMIGQPVDALIHPEDLPTVRQLRGTIQSWPAVLTITYRARHKDGHYIWLETTNKLISDPETGTVIEIVAVSRDVSQRKEAEEALRTLNRRMQDELVLAREIQQGLLSPARPGWPDLEVVCYSMPAHEVGGDFYRYHHFPGDHTHPRRNKYAFAIGDVSGKGVSAALLMAAVAAQFDASLPQKFNPAERLVYLDTAILSYTRPRRQNCGLCYLELEQIPDSSLITLCASNAGGIAPYLKQTGGLVEQLEIGGFALGQGLSAETGYREANRLLAKGDMIILTSDGLLEVKNEIGEIFGFQRFEQAIAQGPVTNAEAMLNYIVNTVMHFAGETELHDDLTTIVIQI